MGGWFWSKSVGNGWRVGGYSGRGGGGSGCGGLIIIAIAAWAIVKGCG